MNKLSILVIFIVSIAFTKCGDKSDSALDITLFEEIGTIYLPGSTLRITGIATDSKNLSSLTIYNELMQIDEHYNLSALEVSQYEFDFIYVLPNSLLAGKYNVEVRVENTEGQVAVKELEVDFAKVPEFIDMETNYAAKRGEVVVFQGGLRDEQGLTAFQVICLDLDLNVTYEISGNPINYSLTESFVMPSWPETGTYIATLFAYNSRGLVSTIDGAFIEVLDE